MSDATEPTLIERFKPTIGRWWGVVGIVMMALVVVAILSSGIDAAALAIATGAVLLAWGAYASLVRPTIHAYEDHLLLRNALSDLRVPWRDITAVAVRQTTCIYTGPDLHHGIAIGKSARHLIRRQQRTGGALSQAQKEFAAQPTLEARDATGMHYADYVELRIDSLRKQQGNSTDALGGVHRDYSWPVIIPGAVLGVVFVVLVAIAIA